MAHDRPQPQQTLPAPVPNWPELEGHVIGFRPAEATSVAASWFNGTDGLPEVEAGLSASQFMALPGATTGEAVDTATGELVRLVPTVETHPKRTMRDAKIRRRLVIAGGKIAIECDHLDKVEKRLAGIDARLEIEAFLDDLDAEYGGQTARFDDDQEDDPDAYRGVIWEFSRKSRQRLRQRVAEADWYLALSIPGVRIGMLTLTYPGEWEIWAPNPERITAHRHALERRLERALGYVPPFFWVREFQGRGAPHFHLAGAWPARIEGVRLENWLSRTWWEIVGTERQDHLDAGTRVDWSKGLQSSDPNRLAAYFSAYTTGEDGKEYQHHPPEGWCNENGSAGRHWGYRGVELTRSEVVVSRDDMIEAQRFLRRYIASQKRTKRMQRKPTGPRFVATGEETEDGTQPIKCKDGKRPRSVNRRWKLSSLTGLDTGFTLLTNDGPGLAVALARAINQPEREEPWPPGQPRPLP